MKNFDCVVWMSWAGLIILLTPLRGMADDAIRPGDLETLVVTSKPPASILAVPSLVAVRRTASIVTPVAGKTATVDVQVGDRVKKGNVLARIDPRYFELKVKVTVSELALKKLEFAQLEYLVRYQTKNCEVLKLDVSACEKEVDKYRNALKLGAVAQGELDMQFAQLKEIKAKHAAAEREITFTKSQLASKKAAVKVATAHLEEAKLLLERTVIKAPFSGVVRSVNIGKGEYAVQHSEIISLADISALQVLVRISRNNLLRVAQESHAPVIGLRTLGKPTSQIPVRILSRQQSFDRASNAVVLTLAIQPTIGASISPGAPVEVVFLHGKSEPLKPGTFVIPTSAVFPDRKGGMLVWVVDCKTSRVHGKPVSVRNYDETHFVVSRG